MPAKKTKKKKSRKMDRKLLSNQPHEIKHMAKKTKKKASEVRAAKKKVGRSSKAVVKELTETQSSATSKTFTNDSSAEKIK